MAANNTSAFNCREVSRRPGVWSQHAFGTAIDINPVQNPYILRNGTVLPPGAVTDRSTPVDRSYCGRQPGRCGVCRHRLGLGRGLERCPRLPALLGLGTLIEPSRLRRLEHIGHAAWPSLEDEWLNGWLLRAGGGVTRRSNSANPVDDSWDDLDTQVDQRRSLVRAAEAAAHCPAHGSGRPRDRSTAGTARGYERDLGAVIMTRPIAGLVPVRIHDVHLSDRPLPSWLESAAREPGRGGAKRHGSRAVARPHRPPNRLCRDWPGCDWSRRPGRRPPRPVHDANRTARSPARSRPSGGGHPRRLGRRPGSDRSLPPGPPREQLPPSPSTSRSASRSNTSTGTARNSPQSPVPSPVSSPQSPVPPVPRPPSSLQSPAR